MRKGCQNLVLHDYIEDYGPNMVNYYKPQSKYYVGKIMKENNYYIDDIFIQIKDISILGNLSLKV